MTSAIARLGGATAHAQAEAAARVLADSGLEAEVVEEDSALWTAQRSGQRSPDRAVVRVSGLQTELAPTLRAAQELGDLLVGRASLGISWITLDPARIGELRERLRPLTCVVLDAPRDVRASLDVWDAEPSALAQRVKAR